ncbi:M48 family metallopeptidase [Qipengyuania marisflavi]|uniref:M48 family metallopeptidase n=1 Tax=Qipengyuania marisflavi TaxID=2486356 RepID=A0A5S3NYS2_9SPHN|nr:YgjP-like metallopeptidase domain-containing protein [Qipengyuania marisflavi]TMM45338.1 M48 family metallopeptidase [Qipengyuania marisflavi]
MIDWLRRDNVDPMLEVGGRILPVELNRHRRARRLVLRLAPDGSAVRITLPHWCRSQEALAFAKLRSEWLAQQLAKIPERRDPLSEGALDYRGTALAIAWDEANPRKPRRGGDTLHIGGPEVGLPARLQRWLESEALACFTADAADYCAAAALPDAPVRLSRAKRRWGSCSSEGVLRLNWRLVQAPDSVRRSVVAHEVAHLVHFDHSPAFHALLADIYEDDVAAANSWLSRNGRGLYATFG